MGNTVNLDRVGGKQVSAADVVDTVNSAIRVNLVAGAGGGGGPATIADGADVAEGTTTDAAVVSDVAGTVSAKLRGLVKLFADVWDSVNHRLKVDGSGVTQPVSNAGLSNIDVALSSRTKPADQQHSIVDSITAGSNIIGKVTTDQTTHGTTDLVAADITKVGGVALSEGQKAMASSIPVVVASDQSVIPVSAASLPLPTGAALDATLTSTQNEANEALFRTQVIQVAQQAEILSTQPANGFSPMTEVPAFLGGF